MVVERRRESIDGSQKYGRCGEKPGRYRAGVSGLLCCVTATQCTECWTQTRDHKASRGDITITQIVLPHVRAHAVQVPSLIHGSSHPPVVFTALVSEEDVPIPWHSSVETVAEVEVQQTKARRRCPAAESKVAFTALLHYSSTSGQGLLKPQQERSCWL